MLLTPLTPIHVPAFERLLGMSAFGGCFCAVWTAHGPDWSPRCSDPDRPNLAETAKRVAAGEHVGFLMFDNNEPIAWTGAGPRAGFPALATRLGSRAHPTQPTDWVIGCLAIRPSHRGQGLSQRIVEQCCNLAAQAGAQCIDAFPTRPWDEPRSYRGSERLFHSLGFRVVGFENDGTADILVMRRDL